MAKLVGNLLAMSAELPAPLSQSAFDDLLSHQARQARPINQDQELGLCLRCFAQMLFWRPMNQDGGFDLCEECLAQLLTLSPNGAGTDTSNIRAHVALFKNAPMRLKQVEMERDILKKALSMRVRRRPACSVGDETVPSGKESEPGS